MAAAVEVPVQNADKADTKGVAFVKKQLALVQSQLKKSLSGFPQTTLDRVKAALKVDRLARVRAILAKTPFDKVEKAVADGQKLTEDAVQKLGLAKIADVSALKTAFEGLQKTIEQLKKRVDALAKSPEA